MFSWGVPFPPPFLVIFGPPPEIDIFGHLRMPYLRDSDHPMLHKTTILWHPQKGGSVLYPKISSFLLPTKYGRALAGPHELANLGIPSNSCPSCIGQGRCSPPVVPYPLSSGMGQVPGSLQWRGRTSLSKTSSLACRELLTT